VPSLPIDRAPRALGDCLALNHLSRQTPGCSTSCDAIGPCAMNRLTCEHHPWHPCPSLSSRSEDSARNLWILGTESARSDVKWTSTRLSPTAIEPRHAPLRPSSSISPTFKRSSFPTCAPLRCSLRGSLRGSLLLSVPHRFSLLSDPSRADPGATHHGSLVPQEPLDDLEDASP
jgi:hypothetical protein